MPAADGWFLLRGRSSSSTPGVQTASVRSPTFAPSAWASSGSVRGPHRHVPTWVARRRTFGRKLISFESLLSLKPHFPPPNPSLKEENQRCVFFFERCAIRTHLRFNGAFSAFCLKTAARALSTSAQREMRCVSVQIRAI